MSALTPLLLDYDNAARLLGMTRAALRDLVYVTAVRLRSSLAAGRCSPTATSRPGSTRTACLPLRLRLPTSRSESGEGRASPTRSPEANCDLPHLDTRD